ncbi:MAG: CHASE2 domain-containing protein [Alphaproteobacteria bacterium]
MNRWLQVVLPLLFLLAAAALRAADPGAVADLRLMVFDNYQRAQPRAYERVPVTVVDLDDDTLAKIGQWPWPRTQLADLIGRLDEAGAATVALDIVLSEPDRTSPGAVVALWPDLPEIRALRGLIDSGALPDHDTALARRIEGARVVVGFAQADGATATVPPMKAGVATLGADPSPHLLLYPGAVPTLAPIGDAAAGSGAVGVAPEADGVIRRVPLLVTYDGKVFPSLAAEALRVALGASTYVVRSAGASGVISFGEETGITDIRIGDVVVPTDSSGRVWLFDTGPVPERMLPAWQVFDGTAPADRIDGHIVLIGTSAAGLKDIRPSPLDPAAPGVVLQAQVLEQILSGAYLARPDWADGAEFVFLLVLGGIVLVIMSLRRASAAWAAGIAALGIGAALTASWLAYSRAGLLFDPIYPAIAVLGVHISSSLLRYLRTEREKHQIRSAFAHYMAPALVERIAEDPKLLKLGGEMREITILFCDIRGFTSISERFSAEELTHLINRFLTPMTDTILSTGGTIDKYMGDCIMAFWNAPLDDPQHQAHACAAALAMRARLEDLNRELSAEAVAAGRPPIALHVGIGLNTGVCCVGNMGSAQRFDYSALGDDVNLASRLEGQCKTYGVTTILGASTRDAVADRFTILELDLIQVKGKSEPERIHALLAGPELAADPAFGALGARHDAMLAAYRGQRWDEAADLATACRADGGRFGLAELYDEFLGRIAGFRAAPPPPDWDGVHVSTSK